jgi:hypothetical protein
VLFSLVSHRSETYKSEAKRKWNEAKTKRKKEAKNCHLFSFEAKWSETEAKNCHYFLFKLKWSETEAKNCYLKRNENEMKRKQNEKEAKRKIFGSETKQNSLY